MTLDTLSSIALDLVYLAVLAATLRDWHRHRDPFRRAVVILFAASSLVLIGPLVRFVVPAATPFVSLVTLPALISLPLLIVWLLSYIRDVPRTVRGAVAAVCVALIVGFFAITATGVQTRSPAFSGYAIALLAYFLVVDGAGAVGFGLAARHRAGASRSRLLIAAVATASVGLSIIVLLGFGLATEPGSTGAAAASVVGRVLALLSAFGYLAAFAPPRAIRRVSQQATLYGFIRNLQGVPAGSPIPAIWELLAATARRASGAIDAQVVERGRAPDEVTNGTRLEIPFRSERWPEGRLIVDVPRHALFLEDDLE